MYDLHSIQNIESFNVVKKEWDDFIIKYFPTYFYRKSAWLKAWWQSYANDNSIYIFIIRDKSSKQIFGIAPLMISQQFFSGFIVKKLELLGKGIGCEDFLLLDQPCSPRTVVAYLRKRSYGPAHPGGSSISRQ